MKDKPTTIVVIPFYNEALYIQSTLASLANQRTDKNLSWSVVFVDNASTDNTKNLIQTFCKRYHLWFTIVSESRRGTVYSRITGLNEASRYNPEYMISTDADTRLPPTFIQSTYDDFDKYHAMVISGQRETIPLVDLWKKTVSKDIYNWHRMIWNLEYRLFGPYFFGSYFAIKTSLYNNIPQLPPEEYAEHMGEDILLSHRCHFVGAAVAKSSIKVTPHPRTDIALQRDNLIRTSGNTPQVHNIIHSENTLIFQRLTKIKERQIKNQILDFTAKRCVWSSVDAYVFWKKTGMIHTNAYQSAKSGLCFLQIPMRELSTVDGELNQNILFSLLISRHKAHITKELQTYLHDKTA